MLTAEKLVTADELLAMPNSKHLLLVKGVLRKMSPVGWTHGKHASRIDTELRRFVEANDLGEVGVEIGFRLSSDPDTVLAPDVAFVAKARIPAEAELSGYFPGAPDIAVEVISPGETDEEVQEKVALYLQAGARQVWAVRPKRRTVTVHYPDGTARTLTEAMTLSGEDVLPGFGLALSELFA
jgi:Uma2 family endonuclease